MLKFFQKSNFFTFLSRYQYFSNGKLLLGDFVESKLEHILPHPDANLLVFWCPPPTGLVPKMDLNNFCQA
jgi:hypothetical protein